MPSGHLFLWVTIAMVSFRTMAMGINRLLDIKIDARNPRTKERALPKGILKKSYVWIFAGVSFLIFEYSAWILGDLCFYLSPIPVGLALIYPFTKKFTWTCHFVLGIILGMAPYGAWIASQNSFALAPTFLMIGVALWVAGFDMIYALQDIEFDRKNKLFSVPAIFGITATINITWILHLLSVICWLAGGYFAGAGLIYVIGIVLVSIFLIIEHGLIRAYGVSKMNEAFFVMNSAVSVGLFLMTVLDIFWKIN